MRTLYATEAVNIVEDGDGIRIVCRFCGRMSGRRAEIGILDLPLGWSCAPYPDDFAHADGSAGSLYTCPTCRKRRDFPISPREYLR